MDNPRLSCLRYPSTYMGMLYNLMLLQPDVVHRKNISFIIRTSQMSNRKILIYAFVALLVVFQVASSQISPQVGVDRELVQDLRKAQLYLRKQLEMYDRRRADNYTLFLAVKNYAYRLADIEARALDRLKKQIAGQNQGKNIQKVYLASLGPQKGNGNGHSSVQRAVVSEDRSTLFFNRWKIDLTKLLTIQDNPSIAITPDLSSRRNGQNDSDSSKRK